MRSEREAKEGKRMEREEIVNIDLPQWELLPDIGLYMDQVITLMDRTFSPALPKGEMTKSMVNNYVKVGLIPRPVGKKYDREHLAMLLMICVLKQALSMESISQILLALCEEGVQTGYGRFCAITRKIEKSARGGHIELFDEQIDAQEMALRSGVMAALCTIHTCRLLESCRA